ncbi:LARP6 isoform 3, partial [Pan troglodytes]
VDELEDEEEGAETRGAGDPARYLSPGWGSASEEEPSRGHRTAQLPWLESQQVFSLKPFLLPTGIELTPENPWGSSGS